MKLRPVGTHAKNTKKPLSGNAKAKQRAEGESRGPETPSVVSTPTSNSPPGITFTRSTALGLPSPILAGLFRQHGGGGGGGNYTPRDGYAAAGDSGAGGAGAGVIDGAIGGSDSARGGKETDGDDPGGVGETATARGGSGGGGSGGRPQQARKGAKLGLGARARTLPAGGTQASPEGG